MANYLGDINGAMAFMGPDGQPILTTPEAGQQFMPQQQVTLDLQNQGIPGITSGLWGADYVPSKEEIEKSITNLGQKQDLRLPVQEEKILSYQNMMMSPEEKDQIALAREQQNIHQPSGFGEFGEIQQQQAPSGFTFAGKPLQVGQGLPQGKNTGGLQDYFNLGQQALSSQFGIDKKLGEAKAKEYESLIKEQEIRQADYVSRRQKMQDEIDSQRMKVNQLSDEFNKASAVDPNRMWKNASTGQKIAGGLAILLGGIGAALQGTGKNLGLEAINSAIDRDIDAQKTELSKKTAGLQANTNLLGMLRQQLGDNDQAEAMFRKLAIDNATMRLDAIGAGLSNDVAKTKYLQGRQALEGQKLVLQSQILSKGIASSAFKVAQEGGGRIPKEYEAQVAQDKDLAGRIVPIDDKNFGIARTEKDGEELREGAARKESILASIQKIEEIRKKGITDRSFWSENRGRMSTIKGSIKNDMRVGEKMGTLDEGSDRLLDSMIGNPNDWTPYEIGGKLEELKSLVEQKYQKKLQQSVQSYKPFEGVTRDEKKYNAVKQQPRGR